MYSTHVFCFLAANSSLGNQKRKMEGDIHQMQADLDNMLAQSKSAEEKAKKAMVDAGRLADELRAEQDHTAAQDKVCLMAILFKEVLAQFFPFVNVN